MAKREGLQRDGLAAAAADAREQGKVEANAALHRGARRALELTRAKQAKTAAEPAKVKKPKARRKSGQRNDTGMVDQLVSPEQQRHGDYQASDFKLQEVTEGGKRVEKTMRVVRNLGRTQVERWHARGVFNERQMAAILFYQEAYRAVFGEGPKVTASYSPAIARGAQGAIELWAASTIAAKEALRLIDNEVNFKFEIASGVWPVWQNVVIWDEPSGIAGGRIGFTHKPAEAAAKVIVLMVSSMIADIVIDSSRRDFGELLLDLDQPRRPSGHSTSAASRTRAQSR